MTPVGQPWGSAAEVSAMVEQQNASGPAVDANGELDDDAPALVLRTEIAGPGVYTMPPELYHADPAPAADGGSLSSTGARKILPPSTPLHFQHWREHGEPAKAEFTFGHAAHRKVLTEGAAIVVVDAENYRTNAAKAERDAALAEGKIPLLPKDVEIVDAMAAALLEHPMAARLLSLTRGTPEQSLFWRHPRTGRWCRARPDHLPTTGIGRRYVLADYKTAADASRDGFEKATAQHGYYQQDPFYRDGVRVLGIDPDPAFVFVVQEKAAPYAVNVIELDADAVEMGRRRNDIAHTRFDRCLTENRWPGYGDDVTLASLPRWLLAREDLA